MHSRIEWNSWGQWQWLERYGTREICFIILIAANILWFWEPLRYVLGSTLEDEYSQNYSHIVVIPFLCVVLLYLQRAAIFSIQQWSPLLGATMLISGGAVSLAAVEPMGEALDRFSLAILAFVVMCWGAFLFCYGIQAFRIAFFGLSLMVLMVPLPSGLLDAIIGFLQRSSADSVEVLFFALGIPVIREEFIFTLSDFTIFVAEECSGIRSFLSLIITSLVAGHWFLNSWWARVVLVVGVVPLAIAKNAIRIVGLALLANYVDPTYITDSVWHRAGGIPLFLLSLVVLFGGVWILRRCESRSGSTAN